jgi:hypothetical protein
MYLLSFRCYGISLHGDPRGSVDRAHNTPGSRFLAPNLARQQFERTIMTESAYDLNESCRWIVLAAIQELCDERKWPLIAVHVLSQHVHVVADVDGTPERAIGAMKAYASIRIRAAGCDEGRTKR